MLVMPDARPTASLAATASTDMSQVRARYVAGCVLDVRLSKVAVTREFQLIGEDRATHTRNSSGLCCVHIRNNYRLGYPPGAHWTADRIVCGQC